MVPKLTPWMFPERLRSSGHLATSLRVDTTSLPDTEITALLGRGTHFEGKLLIEGRVRLDGAFAGSIYGDATLIIGEGASLDAQIEVANVIVRGGTVKGQIRARQAIELYVPARVDADLQSPSVYIEKGVHFEGSCRMAPLEEDEEPGPMDVEDLDEQSMVGGD